jgi:hypothetical protein
MPQGFVSVSSVIRPAQPNGRAFIWAYGHDAGALDGGVTRLLADTGYLVVVVHQPLTGRLNRQHWPLLEACRDPDDYHAYLRCVDYPLQFFMTPLAEAVNWLRAQGYRDIRMGGLSGGGWSTAVYAAVDPRIVRSYPVAGTLPYRHVCADGGWPLCAGDYEQRPILQVADHDTLAVLGAWGPGRRQLAIYNEFDTCCFAGRSAEEWGPPLVQAALRRLGTGRFEALILPHDDHSLAPAALAALTS